MPLGLLRIGQRYLFRALARPLAAPAPVLAWGKAGHRALAPLAPVAARFNVQSEGTRGSVNSTIGQSLQPPHLSSKGCFVRRRHRRTGPSLGEDGGRVTP